MISYEMLTARNAGIIQNQECLRKATVAIGGCGGAGGEVAGTLARMGVGNIRVADPDSFDVSNLNRQFGSSVVSIGQNKAQVIADMISDINPHCRLRVVSDGITEENAEEFLEGADIALEEIDFTQPYYTAVFHRAARRLGISVLTALPVGWTSFLFNFVPDGMSYEEYVGLDPECEVDEFKTHSTPVTAYCPEQLRYVNPDVIQAVAERRIDIPAIAPAVNLTAGILSSFVYFYLSSKKQILPVPWYYSTGDMFELSPKKNAFI